MNKNYIKQTNQRLKWANHLKPAGDVNTKKTLKISKPQSSSILQPITRNYVLPKGLQAYFENSFPKEFIVYSLNNRLNNYAEFQELKKKRQRQGNGDQRNTFYFEDEEEDPQRFIKRVFRQHTPRLESSMLVSEPKESPRQKSFASDYWKRSVSPFRTRERIFDERQRSQSPMQKTLQKTYYRSRKKIFE